MLATASAFLGVALSVGEFRSPALGLVLLLGAVCLYLWAVLSWRPVATRLLAFKKERAVAALSLFLASGALGGAAFGYLAWRHLEVATAEDGPTAEEIARALKRQDIPETVTLSVECTRSYPPPSVPDDRQMGTVFVSDREDKPFVYFAPSFDWKPGQKLAFPGFDNPVSVLHCRLVSDLTVPLFNASIALKTAFQLSLLVPDGKGGFSGGERSPMSHIKLPIARFGAQSSVSLYVFNASGKILEVDLTEEGSVADVGAPNVTRPVRFVRRMEERRPFSLMPTENPASTNKPERNDK